MWISRWSPFLAVALASSLAMLPPAHAQSLASQAPARRPVAATDIYRLRSVRDPQLSPEGSWVAYTVSAIDSAKDRAETDIWMTSWDGTQTIRVTATPGSESSPRWSPDGRWLAFLSSRQGGDGGQVWLLDRRGGEAQRLTTIRDGVADLVWSPDAARLALVASIRTDSAAADTSRPHPIVIDRYAFKQDREGYLTRSHSHLFLLDVASRKVDTLTTGDADEASPAWSPDGSRLAFVRTPEVAPGSGENSDVWVMDSRPGGQQVRLTDFPMPRSSTGSTSDRCSLNINTISAVQRPMPFTRVSASTTASSSISTRRSSGSAPACIFAHRSRR